MEGENEICYDKIQIYNKENTPKNVNHSQIQSYVISKSITIIFGNLKDADIPFILGVSKLSKIKLKCFISCFSRVIAKKRSHTAIEGQKIIHA